MANQIDLIVQGAQLVTSSDMAQIDLYVHEGKVIGLGRLELSSKEVVDGKGLFLLPGMVDAHVHFMDPGDPTREDFPAGSAAAAVAGVTTVVEHSHGSRVTNGETLRKKAEYLKDRSVVDFALGAHFSPNGLEEIEEVLREGAAFIKVFTCTTHGVDAVENGRLFRAMRNFAPAGALYLVHAEDESLTRVAETELRGAGREDGMVIPEWRNLLAERVAVTTVGQLAQASGANVAIAHCSHPTIVDIVTHYRAWGARICAEGCPQYFYLREDEIKQLGAFRKFTPPARALGSGTLKPCGKGFETGRFRISRATMHHPPVLRRPPGRFGTSISGCRGSTRPSRSCWTPCAEGV